ncbi:hypothetical protein ACFX1Q_037829 [Malus domestica]
MPKHTTSNSFKCLFGSSMDSPWYFGMWWSKLDFNSNSSVLPCAAVGYWIHKGAALSNPEAASSFKVRFQAKWVGLLLVPSSSQSSLKIVVKVQNMLTNRVGTSSHALVP